jgi:DNA-binding CsgD family transcriptional regulator
MPSRVSPSLRRRRRSDLLRQASTADTATEVFAAAAAALHDLVPHAAATWLSTDPVTGLPTAPSLLDGFSAPVEVCTEHWHREFAEPDFNRFPVLSRAERPAAALRETTGDPSLSTRYRWFMQPMGYADELRAVLRVGGVPWGIVTLWRHEGEPAFSAAEADVLAGLSTPLGDSLRQLSLTGEADDSRGGFTRASGPMTGVGMLMFDERCRLVSANEHAAAWLDELPPHELVPTQFGLQLPLWLVVTAARARESLAHGGDGVARARVRSRRGRWVVGQASTTYDADGTPAGTAVTLEAANPAQVAPILVEAYGLTARERDITRLVARGAGTSEIATELYLSPHTVRDHVKAILTKVGVSSRGELVARLYRTDYEPRHFSSFAQLE